MRLRRRKNQVRNADLKVGDIVDVQMPSGPGRGKVMEIESEDPQLGVTIERIRVLFTVEPGAWVATSQVLRVVDAG